MMLGKFEFYNFYAKNSSKNSNFGPKFSLLNQNLNLAEKLSVKSPVKIKFYSDFPAKKLFFFFFGQRLSDIWNVVSSNIAIGTKMSDKAEMR